jgi:hypothetical protein
MLPLIVGIVFAFAVGVFGTRTGLDRDRAFYPTVMIVIALYYVLFAVMGGETRPLLLDLVVCTVFAIAATAGFKRSLWIVVAALAGHGLMDLVHGNFIANRGVPSWWPVWCCAYDVCAAAYLAWLLQSGRVRAAS